MHEYGILRAAPYNIGMRTPLLPADASLHVRERQLIGVGVTLLHLLLAAVLLPVAGQGVPGTGDRLQANGAALSVTFVTLSPPEPSTRVPPISAHLLAPTPEHNADALSTRTNAASIKTPQALSETGEQASSTDPSQAPRDAVKQITAASTAPAAKGSSPSDDLLANYHAAMRVAIRRKWAALTDRPFPSGCALQMTLAAGGVLNATSANDCNLPREDSLQLEAAALMAQPLPYAGYEAVFVPKLQLQL